MKSLFFSIVGVALIVGLLGCGNAERTAGRQKFKEAVAAVKVRTQGSTYSEFRQAELDMKTIFETNKKHLSDVSDKFSALDELLSATDVCWSYNIKDHGYAYLATMYPPNSGHFLPVWQSMQIVSPEVTKKLNFALNYQQKENDPNFYPATYVKLGLTKINEQTEDLLDLLDKK
jgi:hypothetical protein